MGGMKESPYLSRQWSRGGNPQSVRYRTQQNLLPATQKSYVRMCAERRFSSASVARSFIAIAWGFRPVSPQSSRQDCSRADFANVMVIALGMPVHQAQLHDYGDAQPRVRHAAGRGPADILPPQPGPAPLPATQPRPLSPSNIC